MVDTAAEAVITYLKSSDERWGVAQTNYNYNGGEDRYDSDVSKYTYGIFDLSKTSPELKYEFHFEKNESCGYDYKHFTGVESYSWLSNTTLKLNGPSSEKSVTLNLEDKPENIKNVLDEAEKLEKYYS